MATLNRIKALAAEHETDAEAIIDWHKAAVAASNSASALDLYAPMRLGPLDQVEAVLDKAMCPIYVIEGTSRSVSIASTYSALYEHESRR